MVNSLQDSISMIKSHTDKTAEKETMLREKKIVVVHGYNLNAPDWEHVVVGDFEEGRLGRIPKAIYIALCEGADHILWNTGASRKVWKDGSELFEAQYSYRYACEQVREWTKAFPRFFDNFPFSDVVAFLHDERKHLFEEYSTNTLSSAYEALPILDKIIGTDPAHVINVSSRNHERAGHHLMMLLQQGYRGVGPLKSRLLRISFEIADTGYNNDGAMEFVQINECSGKDQYAPKT